MILIIYKNKYISIEDIEILKSIKDIRYVNERFVLTDFANCLNEKISHIDEWTNKDIADFLITYEKIKNIRKQDIYEIENKIAELNEVLEKLKDLQEKELVLDEIYDKAIDIRINEL